MNYLNTKLTIFFTGLRLALLLSLFIVATPGGSFAQLENAKPQVQSAPMSEQSFFGNTLMFMVAGFLGYFMIVTRPQQLQEQERKKIVESLKKNDSVLVSDSILGKIVQLQDGEAVVDIGTAGTSLKIKAQANSLKPIAIAANINAKN